MRGHWRAGLCGGHASASNPQYLLSLVPDHTLAVGASFGVGVRITQESRAQHPRRGLGLRVAADVRRGLVHAEGDLQDLVGDADATLANAVACECIVGEAADGRPLRRFVIVPSFGQVRACACVSGCVGVSE